MRDFSGKVAVVTGAASGIGFGLATRFAQEGMRVVLADVEEPALEAAVARLRQRDYDVAGVPTDVACLPRPSPPEWSRGLEPSSSTS